MRTLYVVFNNDALGAYVTAYVDVPDDATDNEIEVILAEENDDLMLDYVDDDEDYENIGGTRIIWKDAAEMEDEDDGHN